MSLEMTFGKSQTLHSSSAIWHLQGVLGVLSFSPFTVITRAQTALISNKGINTDTGSYIGVFVFQLCIF